MMPDNRPAGLGLDDQDRLPWLEAAEVYEEDERLSPLRLTLLVLAGLVLIGGVLGGLWWWQSGGPRAPGQTIAAPEGPYKVAPTDDGAKAFEGEGDASFAASEGLETSGKVDPRRLPEEPAVVAAPAAPVSAVPTVAAKSAAAPAKGPVPVAKAPVAVSRASEAPKSVPATAPKIPPAPPPTDGSAVQLGAFSSEGSANKAWASLAKRFPYLADLGKSVAPASVGGNTVYRLRAAAGSAAAARDICAKLRVAGENCAVVP
jgi:hypothetical protein